MREYIIWSELPTLFQKKGDGTSKIINYLHLEDTARMHDPSFKLEELAIKDNKHISRIEYGLSGNELEDFNTRMWGMFLMKRKTIEEALEILNTWYPDGFGVDEVDTETIVDNRPQLEL